MKTGKFNVHSYWKECKLVYIDTTQDFYPKIIIDNKDTIRKEDKFTTIEDIKLFLNAHLQLVENETHCTIHKDNINEILKTLTKIKERIDEY